MIAVAAGLVLGLAGSAHCGAMCGPLAVLVEGATPAGDRARRWRRRGAYHAGRLSMYVALGAAAGLVGGALREAGIGRGLALLAGLALIGQAALALRPGRQRPRVPGPLTHAVRRAADGLRRRAIAHPAALGALNGLLPCGLIYAALAAAAAAGGVGGGLAVMLGFGLGTVPALLGVSLLASAAASRPGLRRIAVPVAVAVAGLVLLVRALAPVAHDHDRMRVVPATAAAAPSSAAGHRHP